MTFQSAKKQFEQACAADDGSIKSARCIKIASRDLTEAAENQVIDRLDSMQVFREPDTLRVDEAFVKRALGVL